MKRKRKKQVSYSVKILRERAARRQDYLCFWCGVRMVNTDDKDPCQLTADHHPVPIYAGGKTVPGNIVAACRKCNNSRNSEETNKRKKSDGHLVISSGDNKVTSPFEVLKRYGQL